MGSSIILFVITLAAMYTGMRRIRRINKDWFFVEAKQMVEAHRGSSGGDDDGKKIKFDGVLV